MKKELKSYTKSSIFMDTMVTIKVISEWKEDKVLKKIDQAFLAFHIVEATCNRFDDQSELNHMLKTMGSPVKVSSILFEVIRFAIEVASLSNGVFDPTIAPLLNNSGFNQNYKTGERTLINSDLHETNYKNIVLDEEKQTILLQKPLKLDLGAVAKGFAVDLAAKELDNYTDYAIDAGGDIYVRGFNEFHKPWRIGIIHPFEKEKLISTIELTDSAICTSGNYERFISSDPLKHHLIDPRTGKSPNEIVSCSVIAPFTMMADALSTTAYILGKEKGVQLIEDLELDGFLIGSNLEFIMSQNMKRYFV